MRIVCISDTHGLHREIKELPEGDALIHAGDMSSLGLGTPRHITDLNFWFNELDYEHILVIAGNHEKGFEKIPAKQIAADFFPYATYLQGFSTIIDDITFWGGPWTPRFYDWEFNVDRGELHKYWSRIPEHTDVLITHGPPRGYGDISSVTKENVGCDELLERIEQLPNLKLCVFGHIHGGYGVYDGPNGVKLVNASTCNERYQAVNPPIVIDI
jgi:predicted phosphodiesterase